MLDVLGTRSLQAHTPLVRANLSDLRKDINDSEVGLTCKTPAELESLEKQRENLRKPLE